MKIISFTEAIKYLGKNKHLSARDGVRYGVTTFREIINLVSDTILKNNTNRFEELVDKKDYINKANHLLRFISKISSKGIVLASILSDSKSKDAFVRDVGTMIGLLTKFYDDKQLTANEWKDLIDDIVEKWDPEEKNKDFLYLIENCIDELSEQKKLITYSLKDIVMMSDEINQIFLQTTIPYELNLFTQKEHTKDMVKANYQDKPWNPFDFYDTGQKTTLYDKYHNVFLGEDLLKYFSDNARKGAYYFPKGKIMSGMGTSAKTKRVYCLVSPYTAYQIAKYIDDMGDLDEAAEMIARYSDFKKDNVSKYWMGKYEKMVKNTEYKNMIDFYKDEYLKVFEQDIWEDVTTTIKTLADEHNEGNIGTALQGLDVKKEHTGLFLMSLVLWFREKYPRKGIPTITKYVVECYTDLLKGDVVYEKDGVCKNVPVIEYFGVNSSIYNSTSATQRVQKVFTNLPKLIEGKIIGKQTNRKNQKDYRQKSLDKHLNVCKNSDNGSTLYLFPLSSEKTKSTINFKNGQGAIWIHPNDKTNLAKDGHLGFEEDNTHKDWKDLNWRKFGVSCQKDYWTKVLEHNIEIEENCDDVILKRQLKNGIDALLTFVECDLEIN